VSEVRTATGPGRVNLIGDHTDYNQGLALPLAIGLGVQVEFRPADRDEIEVTSTAFPSGAVIATTIAPDPDAIVASPRPAWSRLVAAMVALARPDSGGTLHIGTTLPVGSGLSSSAALAVALAEVFGVEGPPVVVARLCQEAERLTGVPVGAMDPLVCAGAHRDHALLIDFTTLATEQVPVPAGAGIVVVDSGYRRTLSDSPYALRVAECEAAAARIGPLGTAGPADLAGLRDPLLRRRARHVVTECHRVREVAAALGAGDLVAAGALMSESHASLAEDFESTLPAVDDLVADLVARPGVYGARMTGAGFGGCVVALTARGAVDPHGLATPAWTVTAVDGTVAARRDGDGARTQ
jgi:galactokinase